MTSRQTPCRHAGTRPPGSRAHDLDAVSCPENPCTPNSDANAPPPSCTGVTPSCLQANAGGDAAFMELQFHLPGEAPFVDGISCDNAHWCAALTIDSLECTLNFATCNPNCRSSTPRTAISISTARRTGRTGRTARSGHFPVHFPGGRANHSGRRQLLAVPVPNRRGAQRIDLTRRRWAAAGATVAVMALCSAATIVMLPQPAGKAGRGDATPAAGRSAASARSKRRPNICRSLWARAAVCQGAVCPAPNRSICARISQREDRLVSRSFPSTGCVSESVLERG